MITVRLPKEQGALRSLSIWGARTIYLERSTYLLRVDRVMGQREMPRHNKPLVQLNGSWKPPALVGENDLTQGVLACRASSVFVDDAAGRSREIG